MKNCKEVDCKYYIPHEPWCEIPKIAEEYQIANFWGRSEPSDCAVTDATLCGYYESKI